MRSASSFTAVKPLIVLKAGKSKSGTAAALSHTASMAGSYKVFSSALQQCGVIEAQGLDELFELSKVFTLPQFFGSRIAVLTNGGGNGVLAADAIEQNRLELAEFSPATIRGLKTFLPSTTSAKNPLDIIGDATSARYEECLDLLIEDDGVDAIVCIVLMQTAALDSSIINVITHASYKSKKPIVVVSTGGEYTRIHCKMLEDYKIPAYSSPASAVSSLAKAQKYNIYKLNAKYAES
jgi:acyl-CoA synthetase (NDP forming)